MTDVDVYLPEDRATKDQESSQYFAVELFRGVIKFNPHFIKSNRHKHEWKNATQE